jgi:hypothetical protein
MFPEPYRKGDAMDEGWTALWRKWMPALLATPVMLAVYVTVAIVVPALLETTGGFLACLALATFAGCAAIALVSRALGVYARRRDIEGTPQRQGITSTQLALIAAWLIFPRMGIYHSGWVYVVAFALVGVLGSWVMALVAGRDDGTTPSSTHRFEHATGGPTGGRVAPQWACRVAALFVILSVVSFVRLYTDGTPHFLWGGIALLLLGVLLPSIVVALGGGSERR